MLMAKLLWYDDAWDAYISWQARDKKTLARINRILEDIERNRYTGIAKPEPLKHEFSGWWSRRIDKKNRIVYRFVGDTLEILQCGSHYQQK